MTLSEFQDFLDRISACWTENDFDTWRAHIALPLHFITRAGTLENKDIADLSRDWDLYQSHLRALGITQIIRSADSIEQTDHDSLMGTYRTQMFASGQRVVGPYTSSAMLMRCCDSWRISSIMNALGHRDWAFRQDPT